MPLLSASRTKHLVIGMVRWDPSKKERVPLDAVHFSSAIMPQNPRADGRLIYWNYKSTRQGAKIRHLETYQKGAVVSGVKGEHLDRYRDVQIIVFRNCVWNNLSSNRFENPKQNIPFLPI